MYRLNFWQPIWIAMAWMAFSQASLLAQDPRSRGMIGLYQDSMAPGVIGRSQLERNPMLRGYFQPVEIQGPKGSRVSMVTQAAFDSAQPSPFRAALLVGSVYRFQLSSIPGEEGVEIYPSIEIIDRLYPPPEREHRFPIPVVIEEDDIQGVMRGDMVARVIYLEDSEIAMPVSYAGETQRVHDVAATEEAIQTADHMGRPVAILRIGSRIPDPKQDRYEFAYGSPPWHPIKPIPDREKLIEEHGWPRVEYPEVVPEAAKALEPVRVPVRRASKSIGG